MPTSDLAADLRQNIGDDFRVVLWRNAMGDTHLVDAAVCGLRQCGDFEWRLGEVEAEGRAIETGSGL